MNWRTRALLAGRVVAGVTLTAAPRFGAHLWLGGASPNNRRFVRAIGVRDLVIAAGQLRSGPIWRARWRRAGAFSDLFDAAVSVRQALSQRRWVSALIAVPAVTASVTALRQRD